MATAGDTPRKRPVQAPRKRVQAPKPRGAQPRGRQASPKILLIAAACLVVAGAAIGIGVSVAGSDSTSLKKVAAVRTLLAGIPQKGNTLGSSSAPVTLVEYADLQCPYCDAFQKQVFPGLVRTYVRPGHVQMIVRPLAFIGPDSVRGRNAVVAAGHQNKFFNMMDLLYWNQGTENTGWLSDGLVRRAGKAVGLNAGQFERDRTSAAVTQAVTAFDVLARSQGVRSTPSIFVGKTGGALREVQLSSPTDAASVDNAIQVLGAS